MMIFKNREKEKEQVDPHAFGFHALCDKEVVSVTDGRRLGYVRDVMFDQRSGRILSLILPGQLSYFGIKRAPDCVIPWSAITRIGDDIILVNPDEIVSRKDEIVNNL